MPLTVRAQRPILAPSCLLIFLISLMGLQQLCMGLNNNSSQISEQECSALVQLASQSNLSTNCNCTQVNSLKACNGDCVHTRQHFASCTGGYSVSELYLSNMGMKGNLTWVASFKHIKHLDLSLNHFNGSLPSSIWSLGKLTYVNLSFNSLTGHIPNFSDSKSSTYHYPSLKTLDFSHNQIGGPFPQNLCIRFPNLTQLLLSSNTLIGSANLSLCNRLEAFDASFNRLQGSLLEDLKAKSSLKIINLKHNMLNGSIPSLSSLPQLVNLDVSFNKFSGIFGSENYRLPLNLSKLNVSHNNLEVGLSASMIFNIGVSSFWPNRACRGCFYVMAPSPSPSASAHMMNSGAAAGPSQKRNNFPIKARVDAIIGIVVGCTAGLIFITIISCIIIHKRRRKTAWPLCPKRPVPPFKHVPEVGPFSFESQSGTWVADVKDPSSVPVVIFEKPLMTLTFSDLLQATKSFDREFEVGDGTGLVYACVLPGVLEEKVSIEVVEGGPSLSAEEAHAAFTGMGEVKHDNLVALLGYCIVGEEKLLMIYKHMEGGSLEDVLHAVPAEAETSNANAISMEDWSNMESWPDIRDTGKPACIDWETRQKIALGVARALAYLHNGCRRPVVHGAVSSACILLDGSFKDVRVANYGGAWGLRRRLAPGYVAPETAHMAASYSSKRTSTCDVPAYTSKCDVYGVGVVLLELATGRRAVGNYGASATLVAWVRALTKGKRAEHAVDPRLPSSTLPYLLEMIKVGYLCTADSPSKRPSMQQVVGLLKDLAPH